MFAICRGCPGARGLGNRLLLPGTDGVLYRPEPPLRPLCAARGSFRAHTHDCLRGLCHRIVVALLFVGHVSDWYGRRTLLLPALTIAVLAAVVFLVWRSLAGLVAARVLTGLALGAAVALPRRTSPTLTKPRRRGDPPSWHRGDDRERRWVGRGPPPRGTARSLCASSVDASIRRASRRPSRCGGPRDPRAGRPRGRSPPAEVPATAARGAGERTPAVPRRGHRRLHGLRGQRIVRRTGRKVPRRSTPPSVAGAAGLTVFVTFGTGVLVQATPTSWPAHRLAAAGIAPMLIGLGLLVASAWTSPPSLTLFLVSGVVAGVGVGAIIRASLTVVVTISDPDDRAGTLATFFTAGYIGVSLPVVGIGLALQYLSFRASFLVFGAAVGLGILAAAPTLVHPAAEPAPEPPGQQPDDGAVPVLRRRRRCGPRPRR
jgi:MFS family permease